MTTTLDATTAPVSSDEIDDLIRRGIRNRWYAICPSSFVAETPIAMWRAGEVLVVWRDAHGVVHVQEDRCPHRGAPLSLGNNLGDRIRCIYHGVEIGSDGTVLSVPGSPGCALEGRKALRTFPAVECADAVFSWFGDELHSEPAPFRPPVQLAGDEYSAFLCYSEWNAPFRFVVENSLDPAHGAFLHRVSHSMSQGDEEADFTVRDTEHGFIVEKTTQHDVNFDWAEMVDDGAIFLRLEIPYGKYAGPGGTFGIIGCVTPVDDENCAIFFWRVRRVQGWQRDVWRFLFRTSLEGKHWAVLEQDRALLEAYAPDADRSEHLYRHDLGIARYRKHVRHQAKAQLEALRVADQLKRT
jgi:phenylpropionate dioxygenase-like ring-hydroxylating dioxygenase large terminal subunit